MKTLNKFLLGALALSIVLKVLANVNVILSLISCMLFFALFIVLLSFIDALRVKNADEGTIMAYHKRIEQFKGPEQFN